MDNNNTNSKKQLDEIMRSFKGATPLHCDHCGEKYTDESFDLVRYKNQHAVVHTKCYNCGYSYMLNLFVPAPGMVGTSKSQLNLDIVETRELVNFAGNKSITVNDALDAYYSIVKTNRFEHYLRSKTRFLGQPESFKGMLPPLPQAENFDE